MDGRIGSAEPSCHMDGKDMCKWSTGPRSVLGAAINSPPSPHGHDPPLAIMSTSSLSLRLQVPVPSHALQIASRCASDSSDNQTLAAAVSGSPNGYRIIVISFFLRGVPCHKFNYDSVDLDSTRVGGYCQCGESSAEQITSRWVLSYCEVALAFDRVKLQLVRYETLGSWCLTRR